MTDQQERRLLNALKDIEKGFNRIAELLEKVLKEQEQIRKALQK